MPPLDFSTSQPEENEELISPEELFAPEEATEPEEEDGRRGKGRLREEAEGRIKKRGERELDKYFEEKWGAPKGVGRGAGEIGEGAAKRIGAGATREIGEEVGGQVARGAVGAGGRAVGGAVAKAGAKAVVGAATKVVAEGGAEIIGGGVVAGPWGAVAGAILTVLSLPKSFAGMFKGEYSQMSFVEITIVGVACAFVDLVILGATLSIIFLPVVGIALGTIAFIFSSPVKMLSFLIIAFWITKFKGSEKPWGMFRLIGKITASIPGIAITPFLTPYFLVEALAHNKEGQDGLLRESKRTKESEKKEKKAGGAPAPSEPGGGGTAAPRGSGGAPRPRAAGIKR